MKEIGEGVFDVNSVLIDLEMTCALRGARRINDASVQLLNETRRIQDKLNQTERELDFHEVLKAS
jgi:hypothetical protein